MDMRFGTWNVRSLYSVQKGRDDLCSAKFVSEFNKLIKNINMVNHVSSLKLGWITQ